MKRILAIIALTLALIPVCSVAQTGNQKENTYFLYPTAPESITDFKQKCNYTTWHFWDNCNLKSAFSSRKRMKGAMEDFFSIAVHAAPDTVFPTINKLIETVRKNSADNMLTLGELAEELLYTDSAYIYSEELYLPFAEGVAQTKKINSANRLRFERHAKILGHTQLGMIAPNFEFTRPDGSKGHLHDGLGKRIILVFNDPDCDDCRMTMVRLSADFNLRQLIEKGYLNLYSIYPGEITEEWKASVTDYPSEWIVGALENAEEMFDLSMSPTIIYLDPNAKILSKTIDKGRLIDMLRLLNTNVAPKKSSDKESAQ